MSRSEATEALIDRFATGAEILAYATQQLDREQEQARPGPGAWSTAELVAHLLETDLVYSDRMKRLIAEDNPTLQAFDENAWIAGLGAQETPVAEAVELFVANRRWMTRLLRRLDEADFSRSGTHSEIGRQSLAQILATITNHVDHHVKFLYAKRANLGSALYPRYTRSPDE